MSDSLPNHPKTKLPTQQTLLLYTEQDWHKKDGYANDGAFICITLNKNGGPKVARCFKIHKKPTKGKRKTKMK